MWTMRWRAPAQAVDNARALPTARAFAHMPTARDDQRRTSTSRAPIYCPGLQRIDSLRVADLTPLQAHT
jgi:hypothetical protein